ncbi:MAG: DUF924 family protein [Burkholderiaceae bacterium]
MSAELDPRAREVLDFWFGAPGSAEYGSARTQWFAKDTAFDADVRSRFGDLIERALDGRLDAWERTPPSALARILLLDQYTRNAYRDTPRAFSGDARALAAARQLVASGDDATLPPFQRAFVYLPYEHSETLAVQDEAVRLFERLGAEAPDQAGLMEWAVRHRAVVARFGRFPHRNVILGRVSTADESAFLDGPGSRF